MRRSLASYLPRPKFVRSRPRKRKLTLQTESLEARQVLAADITGTVYLDLNENGVRNQGENGVVNWTVYLDTNTNGSLDAGEPSTLTDADGHYQFTGLAAGSYRVSQVMRSGWHAVNPLDGFTDISLTDGTSQRVDFFDYGTTGTAVITGRVMGDIGGTIAPLSGWTVFIDTHNTGVLDLDEAFQITDAEGVYTFSDVLGGSTSSPNDYEVWLVTPPGNMWDVKDENMTAAMIEGQTTTLDDFVNIADPDFLTSVSGSVWEDTNGNGIINAGELPLEGWRIYSDLNFNGAFDSASEPSALTDVNGQYELIGLEAGTSQLTLDIPRNYLPTSPVSGQRTVTLIAGTPRTGVNFGVQARTDATIGGVIFVDRDRDGVRDAGEEGLPGITVFLDEDNDGILDPTEESVVTSADFFYTPDVDEAGSYRFEKLTAGTYTVRQIVPDSLSSTPETESVQTVELMGGDDLEVDGADRYRPSEIHGIKFEDLDGDSIRDAGEPGMEGITIFLDLDRDNQLDPDEPTTLTLADGSYSFTDLAAGAYVVRELVPDGYTITFPETRDGILWPSGVSNAPVGDVTPGLIEVSLAEGDTHTQTVSLTLPTTGALTNMVDVFLLFDDTGSFTSNSPIVRAAFPNIISKLQTNLPGIDLGFGVGRLEEYGNYAWEYAEGRPFVLNQPIISADATGYTDAEVLASIQAALDREAPGYGGDTPETVIEALYQMVTGRGFDGDNNGSTLDSGPAGLASTQTMPGNSGDVPAFSSFTADPANGVLAPSGNIGGAGFRSGALPIIITATDTGFAYQPKGESTVTGIDGVSLPVTDITYNGRGTTPFDYGAGIQETVTGLNALGALVIGLGTNPSAATDPRIGLEALAKLTGAVNRTDATIANGTPDDIAPGDPFYFMIGSGGDPLATNIADGIVAAVESAVTAVSVNVTLRSSDPRVHIDFTPGVLNGLTAGQTATFDVTFTGDGRPHRFDLQFIREGTDVVLGSIPVVIGTPIAGDGYEFEDCEDGEHSQNVDFGNHWTGAISPNVAPSFLPGADQTSDEDAGLQTVANWATAISAGDATETDQTVSFVVSNDNSSLFATQPTIAADGTLTYAAVPDAFGIATVTVFAQDSGGTATTNPQQSPTETFTITVRPVNDPPVAVNDDFSTNEDTVLNLDVLLNDEDVDGDSLTATIISPPVHGSLTANADGSFTYSPQANFSGTDSFLYVASDGSANSNVATANITVAAVNDAPTAADDSYTVDEDTTLIVTTAGVLSNDSDIDNTTLTAHVVTGPTSGSLTLNSDGSFTYTPNANFSGTDAFDYVASDGIANSTSATVTITVAPMNDAPVANTDNYVTDEDTPFTLILGELLVNDTDIDGDALTARLISLPAHGTLSENIDGSLTYTPDENYNGSDSFIYLANDGTVDSNEGTVNITINPVNDAPVASDDNYLIGENATLTIGAPGVLGNDSDVEGSPLTAVLAVGPSHGTLTFNADGSFDYTPDLNYSGLDSFTYVANDGVANSLTATVNITITAINHAPIAVDDSYITSEDTVLTISLPGLLGNDTDVDGNTLTALLAVNPSHGSLTLNTDGSFTYTPDANFNGTDSFTYRASDGLLDSNTATVNITVSPVNDAPVAGDDAYATSEDTVLTIAASGVLSNDTDVDGDALSANVVSGPANGSLTLNTDGSFTYTPDANFNGTDSFTYQASDGS
ncbi:MAG: tandem-95 repeat protein, partial [Planctomycetales bacterium]|nr:tandem-95 repeat protein [Planctomycetales bacterium]